MSAIQIGFEALGLQDSQHLKNSLTHSEDPLKAISDFQEENSVLLPTLKSALNLLDLHNVRRLDFHMSIADELKDHLTRRVEELTGSASSPPSGDEFKKLEELLNKSFPLIFLPRLQPLIFLIMKGLPIINEAYLQVIKDNESLYSIVPIEVKRQIWSNYTQVFLKELQPHFEKFIGYFDELIGNVDLSLGPLMHTVCLSCSNIEIANKDNLLQSNNVYVNFFKTHKRYQTHVNEICRLIGANHKLYEFTVNKLASLYMKGRDWFFSTLRMHLVIRLSEMHHHDALQVIVHNASNSSHGDSTGEMVLKFCNLISTCLKEKSLGTKRAKELEHIMESKKFDKIIP